MSTANNGRPALVTFDIETAARYSDYEGMPEALRKIYQKKLRQQIVQDSGYIPDATDFSNLYPMLWHDIAGLHPELGMVVCAAVELWWEDGKTYQNAWSAQAGEEEQERVVLRQLMDVVQKNASSVITGFNIINFDIPFVCRRALYLGEAIPESFHQSNAKPWERSIKDVMQALKFGAYSGSTGLQAAALSMGLDDPKQEMSGERIGPKLWAEKLDESIGKDAKRQMERYCLGDVITTRQIAVRLNLHI